jgi:hypothetical protein
MTSPRRTTKKITPLLVALGASIALAGCGHPAEEKPTSSAGAYDISRVDNVKGDFPPGFSVEVAQQKTLDQQDIDNSGINAFTGAQVDPPQCRSLLIPPYAEAKVGTQAAGVRANSDQGNMFVVAMGLPQPVSASGPPAGCDHASVSGDPEATGTAEAIPAPKIDGVTTTGAKLTVSADEDPDYIYTAALNDKTTVVAVGSADADLNPQQLLSNLLVKAVAAVRGQ